MGQPQAIRTRSCPKIKWELSRRNHRRRPVYKQVSLTPEENALRLLKFRMAVVDMKWRMGYRNPELEETRQISRRLARKITVAANAFYLAFGIILAFFIRITPLSAGSQMNAGPGDDVVSEVFQPEGIASVPGLMDNMPLPGPQGFLKSGAMTEITIDGHVTHMINGEPSDYHPLTNIYFCYPGETIPFNTTQTDENGDYLSTMNYVKISEKDREFVKGMKVFGNPFVDKTRVDVGVQDEGNYKVFVVDAGSGKVLLDQARNLPAGNTQIYLSGLGSAGIKIITITDGKNIYSEKLVQSCSGSFSPSINIISAPSEGRSLKNLEFITDSLLIRYETVNSNPEYYVLEKVVEAKTSTVDAVMQQVPKTYSFLIYGYNINEGESVGDSASLKITWGDGTSNIYNSDADGLFHILRENTLDTATNIFFENADTSFFQEWIAGVKRENLITTQEKNLFQNEKENSPPIGSGIYYYPTAAPADLDVLPNIFEVYFVQKWVQDSEGTIHSTRGEVFREVARCRGPPGFVKKWEKGMYDITYLYEMQMFMNSGVPGEPITPEQSLAQKVAMDSVETQVFYLEKNGRQLFPNYERINVVTLTESEWIERLERNFDQVHIINYDNLNGNSCDFTMDSTFSDYYRFKNGIAKYEIYSNMSYKIEELIGSFTHCRDPLNGNLAPKVTFSTGNLTSFGTTMTHMIYVFDPGTIFW